MLVVAFAAMAGFCFWRAQTVPRSRAALPLFYAALGLGVFAKGPPGLLPLLPVATWLWVQDGVRGWRKLGSTSGLALFAALTVVWLVPFLALGTASFGGEVVRDDFAETYFGLPVPGRIAGQLGRALLGFLPWTLAAPLAVAGAWRARRDSALLFALLWLAVPAGVILLSHTQRTRYLLPLYPAAALLAAWWLDAHGGRRTLPGRLLALLAVAAAAAAVLSPLWLGRSARTFLPAPSATALPLMLGVALAGVMLAIGLWRARPALLVYGTAVPMLVVLAHGAYLYDRWVNATHDFRPLAAAVERHAAGTAPGLYLSVGNFLELDFYLGRQSIPLVTLADLQEYLSRDDARVVVVQGRGWDRIREQVDGQVDVREIVETAGERMVVVTPRR